METVNAVKELEPQDSLESTATVPIAEELESVDSVYAFASAANAIKPLPPEERSRVLSALVVFFQTALPPNVARDDRLIRALGIRTAACTWLRRAGIQTIEDLKQKSESQLRRYTGMGPTTLKEIKEGLEREGLSLAPGPPTTRCGGCGNDHMGCTC
jgi:DNA-directed RNA polymerase alpha subunit